MKHTPFKQKLRSYSVNPKSVSSSNESSHSRNSGSSDRGRSSSADSSLIYDSTLIMNIPSTYAKKILHREGMRLPRKLIHKSKNPKKPSYVKQSDIYSRFISMYGEEKAAEKMQSYFDYDEVPLSVLSLIKGGSHVKKSSERKISKRTKHGKVYTYYDKTPRSIGTKLKSDEARLIVRSKNKQFPLKKRIPNLPCRVFYNQCQMRNPQTGEYMKIPDDGSEQHPYGIQIDVQRLDGWKK